MLAQGMRLKRYESIENSDLLYFTFIFSIPCCGIDVISFCLSSSFSMPPSKKNNAGIKPNGKNDKEIPIAATIINAPPHIFLVSNRLAPNPKAENIPVNVIIIYGIVELPVAPLLEIPLSTPTVNTNRIPHKTSIIPNIQPITPSQNGLFVICETPSLI